MKKKDPLRTATKAIARPSRYDGSAEVLAHLQVECERTGHKLASEQRCILSDLRDGPSERSMAFLHAWWCYDL